MADAEAYLEAIQEAIETALAGTYPDDRKRNFIDRTPEGQPNASADQWFISIHDATAQNQTAEGGYHFDVRHGCSITFSQRVAISAEDRIGRAELAPMRDRISTVAAYLMNNQYAVMNAANGKLSLTNTNGFIVPMRVVSPQAAIVRRPLSWFREKDKSKTKTTAAVSTTIQLGGAQRLQVIGGIN